MVLKEIKDISSFGFGELENRLRNVRLKGFSDVKIYENSKIEILQNEWGHLFQIGSDSEQSIEKTKAFIEE